MQQSLLQAMQGLLIDPDDNNSFNEGYKSREIKSSRYEQINPHDVAMQQRHLAASQQQDLVQILEKFPKLLVAF
jgi:hypothetical protein